jgi:hypothetical protein
MEKMEVSAAAQSEAEQAILVAFRKAHAEKVRTRSIVSLESVDAQGRHVTNHAVCSSWCAAQLCSE